MFSSDALEKRTYKFDILKEHTHTHARTYKTAYQCGFRKTSPQRNFDTESLLPAKISPSEFQGCGKSHYATVSAEKYKQPESGLPHVELLRSIDS